MKRFLFAVSLCACLGTVAAAQSKEELKKTYSDRYDLIVSKLGYDGVGVETVLNQWEQVDSNDAKMLLAGFNYYFTKAQTTSVVVKPQKKYLGTEPVLSLKDSTGTEVYYFQEVSYDDSLFSRAMSYLDRAIAGHPARLDFCFTKATALMSYEKDSPDMALSYLLGLVDKDAGKDVAWEYPGYELGDDFFARSMQEFCFAFFNLGTRSSYEAFRTLSERMLIDNPDNPVFMTNIGSYFLVVSKEYDKALKYYRKALKISPDDYTALKNCVLLARQKKDRKLEKKYLEKFVDVAPEDEKAAAQARLDFLKS